jgi:hypothetical protein
MTGSADITGLCFRFLRTRLAGQGRSGRDNHGSCMRLGVVIPTGINEPTGALNELRGGEGSAGGVVGATLDAV